MNRCCFLLLIAGGLIPVSSLPVQAQQASNVSATTSSKKVIGFRTPDWTTAQFADSTKADEVEQTLTRIGCEVNRFEQNGRDNLRYRCPEWKQITLETDDQVAQWNHWLTGRGLVTLIVQPANSLKCSRVSFQLTGTQTLQVRDSGEADYIQSVLEMLGCSVTRSEPEGRIALQITCPEWKTLGCANCPTAHAWQDWLKQQGFATRHSH